MRRHRFAIHIFLTVLAGVMTGCSSPAPPEVTNAVPVLPRCDVEGETRYFRPEMFRAMPLDWPLVMGRMLDAMREPALSCGTEPDSYRILWVHSFTNWGSAMVRMSRWDASWRMIAVQFGDSVKHDEVLRRERTLSTDEARAMLDAASEFGLWNRPYFSWDQGSTDGASWTVEGRRGTSYHPVVLVNAHESQIRKLAFTFWRIAGIKTRLTDR
jgi:hypothetical protein